MVREEQIRQASIEYTMKNYPKAIAGGYFSELANNFNVNPDFIAGAVWADQHPQSQWISVEERLPKQYNGCDYSEKCFLRIAVASYVEYVAGGYDFKNKQWVIELKGEAVEIHHVTHWMRIPELTKRE